MQQLDVRLLEAIESQTSVPDKRGLLALHATMLATQSTFRYLEIGSHLGGSLQALIADPGCTKVLSIDPRPRVQPDERPELRFQWEYSDNTTERMLGLLGRVPEADITKIVTIEESTEDVVPRDLPVDPDLCFIDGEHTNRAALRDAHFCLSALRGEGMIAFHDSHVVAVAIRRFVKEMPSDAIGLALPGAIFVVEVGGRRLLESPAIQRLFEGVRCGRTRLLFWRTVNAIRARGKDLLPLAVSAWYWRRSPRSRSRAVWSRDRSREGTDPTGRFRPGPGGG